MILGQYQFLRSSQQQDIHSVTLWDAHRCFFLSVVTSSALKLMKEWPLSPDLPLQISSSPHKLPHQMSVLYPLGVKRHWSWRAVTSGSPHTPLYSTHLEAWTLGLPWACRQRSVEAELSTVDHQPLISQLETEWFSRERQRGPIAGVTFTCFSPISNTRT